MTISTILIRFGITFVLSLLFGLERQMSNKPIGFGTYIFVACGSCGLAIISLLFGGQNPLPLLGAVVTGIGFLGAGALMKTADRIHGFKSAAGVWLLAIIGLVIGLGRFYLAGAIYVVLWVVLLVDRLIEHRGMGSYQRRLVLRTSEFLTDEALAGLLGTRRTILLSSAVDKDKPSHALTLLVNEPGAFYRPLEQRLSDDSRVLSYSLE